MKHRATGPPDGLLGTLIPAVPRCPENPDRDLQLQLQRLMEIQNRTEPAFFSKWLKSPLSVAAVTPSSARLARAMAAALPEREGLVIELGAGTGPITQALLEAGVRPAELLVIERDAHFHRHLERRFPGTRVLCGDAFELRTLVAEAAGAAPLRAIVSGLPLLPLPAAAQRRLLGQALAIGRNAAPFIQFSYGLRSPLRPAVQMALGLSARCVAQVWRNLPPAKVWVYEAAHPGPAIDG